MKTNLARTIALLLCAVMMLSAFAACGQKPADTSKPGTDKPADASSVKEELVIAMTNDVKALDPMKCWQVAAYHFYWTIYERLIYFNPETGEYEPELAKSWETAEDGMSYTFYLQEGVKWHDGSDFTAEDVKYTIERGIAEGTGNYPGVDHVEVIDPLTVKVHMTAPDSVFMDKQWTGDCCVIKKDSGDQLSLNPIGTGPFKFVEWVSGDHITLEAFDGYWREQSGTKKITFRIIPEANARLVALQTGEIDIAPLTATEVNQATADAKLNLMTTSSITVNYLAFNCQKPPFDNELVRQAICYAIDRDAMVAAQLEGQGITLKSLVAPGKMGYYDGFEGYPYDMAKAKELLTQAGYSDGFECELTLNTGKNEISAQLIQASLGELGIKVKLNVMEAAASTDYIAQGNHDMALNSRSGGSADSYVGMLSSQKLGVNGNRCFYISDEMDALLEESHLTIDLTARNEVYKKIQEHINEHAPLLPLFAPNIFLGANKNVQNVRADNEGCHDYRNTFALN